MLSNILIQKKIVNTKNKIIVLISKKKITNKHRRRSGVREKEREGNQLRLINKRLSQLLDIKIKQAAEANLIATKASTMTKMVIQRPDSRCKAKVILRNY
jgi:hypothetical protein